MMRPRWMMCATMDTQGHHLIVSLSANYAAGLQVDPKRVADMDAEQLAGEEPPLSVSVSI
jgi:hypothetical protein